MSLCVLCTGMYVCVCTYVCGHVSACMHGGQGWLQLSHSINLGRILHSVSDDISQWTCKGLAASLPQGSSCLHTVPSHQCPVSVCKHTIKHGFLHGLHLSSKHLTHWANCLVPGYFIHINLILSKRKSTFANSFWLHTTFHWRSSVWGSPAGFVTTQTGPGWTQTLDLLESIQSNIRKSLKVYFLVVVLHCILCICM